MRIFIGNEEHASETTHVRIVLKNTIIQIGPNIEGNNLINIYNQPTNTTYSLPEENLPEVLAMAITEQPELIMLLDGRFLPFKEQ